MSADDFAGELRKRGLLDLVEHIARMHGATLEEIGGRSRVLHIARARAEVFVAIRTTLGWSYPAIAQLFRRDHTTVLAHVRAANEPGYRVKRTNDQKQRDAIRRAS